MGLFKAIGAVCHAVESACKLTSDSIDACENIHQVIRNTIAESIYDSRKSLSIAYKDYEANKYKADYDRAIKALKE